MEKRKMNEIENEAVLFDIDKYWESLDTFMMWQNCIICAQMGCNKFHVHFHETVIEY